MGSLLRVHEVANILEKNYDEVIAAVKKQQESTLEILNTWKLRIEDHCDYLKDLKKFEYFENEKRALTATIDGLNQTLVDQRIKVAELKKEKKNFNRENNLLKNELEAYKAEVNYLTKIKAPSGDPFVVRKISKLEKMNRELVAKYEKLLILCYYNKLRANYRSRFFKTKRKKKKKQVEKKVNHPSVSDQIFQNVEGIGTSTGNSQVLLLLLPAAASPHFRPSFSILTKSVQTESPKMGKLFTNFLHLEKSKCQILVSIEPAATLRANNELQRFSTFNPGSFPNLIIVLNFFNAIKSYKIFLSTIENRRSSYLIPVIKNSLFSKEPEIIIIRREKEMRNTEDRAKDKTGMNLKILLKLNDNNLISIERWTQTKISVISDELIEEILIRSQFIIENNIPLLSRPKNNRTDSSNRSVRFDPFVKFLRNEDVDSKTPCPKRAKFIQGLLDFFQIKKLHLLSDT